ncbi:GerMN domain-containing protein [Dactylosporangium aurantiacum]|uniref:GerMN domain-containing protein n=1 Tax=Dactylosporangium aurantiacum TaxID=35754 RepID=A0A9Q9MSJ9_9ACTN|nr:GerMN domain-containing protein [Dactylosporangium aurantiacum]
MLLAGSVLAGLVGLAGCGVPDEDSPRPIEPSLIIGSPPAQAPSNPAGAVVERLYLVRDDQLVAVERRVGSTADVAALLGDLVAGPTEAERDEGLSSALTGTDLIAGVRLVDGTAEVSFRPQSGGRTDDILAIGQIVCTLDARTDVDTVRFLLDGQVLKVPRADGSLTELPLTVADYRTLIAER